jgi:hypothetical protein
MKRVSIMSVLMVMVIIFTAAVEKVQKSAGPPSCNAGEPPNNSNCTSCHNDGVANTGTANILLNLGGADTAYIPGKVYTITVSVSKPGMQRAGFQCIALQDNDDKISPGVVTLTDAARTQVLDKHAPHSGDCREEERVWVEHTYAGNSSNAEGVSTWSYHWQAPAQAVGPITFYLAAVEADNDLTETGDQVYTRKTTIAGLPVGIKEIPGIADQFLIHPVPVKHELMIRTASHIPQKITAYDITGKSVKTWERGDLVLREGVITLSSEGIAPGICFLSIEGSFGVVVKKVFVQ